jgi:predicted ATPase
MMSDSFGKLSRLTVRGFKSIREIDDLDLHDINIVVGQNGAGKSNFTQIFRFLAKISRHELSDYVVKSGGLSKLMYFGPKVTKNINITLCSKYHEYSMKLETTSDGALILTDESHISKDDIGVKSVHRHNHHDIGEITPPEMGNFPTILGGSVENWRIYHFHDTSENAPLRSSGPLTEPEQLAADGGNLAAFLYFLQERHPENFAAVLDTVRQIASFLSGFVLRPEALNPNLIRLRWRHVGHDELFDVSDLSDGTLRFIALTALLLQPDPPSTIVLDEPELGLHPAAIAQLAALMHQVAPEVQIIAATQSPTFANHFGWEDFIVADRHDDASRFRRLREDEVRAWMDDYAMGEIWEKNLIGGRP